MSFVGPRPEQIKFVEEYKNAYEIYEKGLNLPGSTVNNYEQIEYVVEAINNV